jgi:two-component system chemotaxis response regulator CheY
MTSKTKILLVDDDPIFSLLMNRVIANSGLNTDVTSFDNGQSAMQYIEQNLDNETVLPEFIFLDINMPIMDGWSFLEEIQAILPFMKKIPGIYILSSSISPFEVERAHKIPCVKDYLVKPLMKRQLTELIGIPEPMVLTMAS